MHNYLGTTGYVAIKKSPCSLSHRFIVPNIKPHPGTQRDPWHVCIPFTIIAAMWAFWGFFVEGSEYSDFLEWLMSLNCTFPAWRPLMRLPQPQRTSFLFGSVIRALLVWNNNTLCYILFELFFFNFASWLRQQLEYSVASPSAIFFIQV